MHEEEDLGPSKSALKRQMTALQKVGEELVGLSDRELEKIPLDSEPLRQAILETRRIRSNNARRRHLQYIGKLMRKVDAQPIENALKALHQQRRGEADRFHELEKFRDELLSAGLSALEQVIQRFPGADRQHLRQLLRQHQREQLQEKPPAASRKLFKYLRELSENQGEAL
jgi:ribosome-associated protein